MRDEASRTGDDRSDEQAPARPSEHGFGDLRHYVPSDLLNVSFPVAVRGYDRRAVDAYVQRANRVIAELKVSASPRAAVTHALEQTEQQVSGLLQRARDTGEEITRSARQEADEIVAKAKADAADLHVNVSSEVEEIKADAERVLADARVEAEDILQRSRLAADEIRTRAQADADRRRRELEEELRALREEAEARMRELEADTDRVRTDRGQLLDDVRERGTRLLELAETASGEPSGEEPEPDDGSDPAESQQTVELLPEARPGRKPAGTGRRGRVRSS